MKSCLCCEWFRFSTTDQVSATCALGDREAAIRFQKTAVHSHIDETDVRKALSEADDCRHYYQIDRNNEGLEP